MVTERCQRAKNVDRGKVKRGRPVQKTTGSLRFRYTATQEVWHLCGWSYRRQAKSSGWNMKLKTAKHADKCLCPILELEHQKMWVCERSGSRYSRVSFCDGSFYEDSLLLRPLSSRTEHSRLLVHRCRNSSVLSLLGALLALFRCACVSSFSVYCSSFKFLVIFPTKTPITKTGKKRKSKQLTLHSFLMSSEPRPGPSSTK